MSDMGSNGGRRPRRRFSEEFKSQTVRLILDQGRSVHAVAKELDLVPSAVGLWVKHEQAERSQGKTGLTKAEREELAALRKENRILREEGEILKKAAAFFTKQKPQGFSSSPRRRPRTTCASCVGACGCPRAGSMPGGRVRNRDAPRKIVDSKFSCMPPSPVAAGTTGARASTMTSSNGVSTSVEGA